MGGWLGLRERNFYHLTDHQRRQATCTSVEPGCGRAWQRTWGRDTYWSRRNAYNSSIFCSLVASSANMTGKKEYSRLKVFQMTKFDLLGIEHSKYVDGSFHYSASEKSNYHDVGGETYAVMLGRVV